MKARFFSPPKGLLLHTLMTACIGAGLTLPLLDADKLSADPTLRGAFYRSLAPMLASSDESERETAARALRYGLTALAGGDITDI